MQTRGGNLLAALALVSSMLIFSLLALAFSALASPVPLVVAYPLLSITGTLTATLEPKIPEPAQLWSSHSPSVLTFTPLIRKTVRMLTVASWPLVFATHSNFKAA